MIKRPNFNAATLFPPLTISSSERHGGLLMQFNVVTKRFTFSKSSMDALKHAAVDGGVINPSQYEVVSAFVWRRLMAISQSKSRTTQCQKRFVASQAVSLRERIVPPSSLTFGNLLIHPFAISRGDETEKKYHATLVQKLRDAIEEVNAEHIKRLQQSTHKGDSTIDDGNADDDDGACEVEAFHFSSWKRLAVNEIDFGWGKPVGCSSSSRPYMNTIFFTRTKDGDAAEIFITLSKDVMDAFEHDQELLSLQL